MPKKLERCTSAVQKSWKSKSASYAICNSSINKKKEEKMEKKIDKKEWTKWHEKKEWKAMEIKEKKILKSKKK